MILNVLHYDSDTFDADEIKNIYNHVKEQLPQDTALIALPNAIKFE